MKTIINIRYILAAAVLAVCLMACDEDFNKDVADPQSWEQEAAKNISFSATPGAAIDLNGVSAEVVSVCSFTVPSVADATIKGYEMELEGHARLAMNEKGQVSVAALQEVVTALYGKRPEARELKGIASALVDLDGQVLRAASGELKLIVTPQAPFIDKAYYLIGNMNNWTADDISKLIKLNQNGDVYENPVFSTVLEVPADCYWKIIPQTRVDAFENKEAENVWGDGVLGCETDGDDSPEGTLVVDGNAMKISDAGWVKIELNMMEYTYKVTFLGNVSPYMYVPGNHQGWNPGDAPMVYSTDFMNYTGFAALDGEFKFTSERNWDGTNYGAGSADGTLSTDGGAGNLSVEKGFYLLKANTSSLTWSATPITTFGLIGDATENGWDGSTPMAFNAATLEYTVTTTLKDGELKFRANDAWDINLGGDISNLSFDGGNITVTAGTYKITLSLANAEKYTCSMEKQ